MFKRILNKIKMFDSMLNNIEYLKNLEINTYSNSLINNIIGNTYLPRTGMSLTAYALAYIVNEIFINERKSIIEFGSGISTILMAKVADARKIDLNIISVDEDLAWINKMQDILITENLQKYVHFIHSPIKTIDNKMANYRWYDEKVLELGCLGIFFDMVVVDGPKAYEIGNELIRYHALHFLQNKLQTDYVVFLDDTNRNGEKSILKKWQDEFNLQFEIRNKLAIAYKGQYLFSNPI
jgi:predicted O-methyltransferase YrrM